MKNRLATFLDIKASIAAGREFSELAYPDIPYCEDSMEETFSRMIEAGTLIVADHNGVVAGGIGGVCAPYFINRNVRMMIENFWWVAPEYRKGLTGIRLLTAFESRARDLSCKYVYMLAMEHMGVDVIESMYLRLGYKPAERGYIKRV